MKNLFISGLTVVMLGLLFMISSCEKPVEQTNREVFFKIGTDQAFRFDDIALYDSSTHILYFKDSQSEFEEILQSSFAFFDKGDTIYAGIFVPGYSSFIPAGPMIPSPSMYGNHALRMEIWRDTKPNTRNCPRIIELLKEHNLLHSGLSGTIDLLEITGTHLSFKFTIMNLDSDDLLIIDMNKTGTNLFHYFTNGLSFKDQNHNEVFSSTITHQKPEPWNSWKAEWLSILKSGDSKSFTINYQTETPIIPGEYNVLFEFPGLAYQVTKEQLYQGNNRIWLGDITMRGKITVQ